MPFASSTAFLHAHRPKTPISSIKGGHEAEDVVKVSAPTAGNHRRNKTFAAKKRTDIAAARDGRLARDRIGLRARRGLAPGPTCTWCVLRTLAPCLFPLMSCFWQSFPENFDIFFCGTEATMFDRCVAVEIKEKLREA